MRQFSLEVHARELVGMGDDWAAYRLESIDTPKGRMVRIVGARCPPKKSGKAKGRPNLAKRDAATERTVAIFTADHDAWRAEREARTGECLECLGEGVRVAGWDRESGETLRPCPRCGGLGKFAPADREGGDA